MILLIASAQIRAIVTGETIARRMLNGDHSADSATAITSTVRMAPGCGRRGGGQRRGGARRRCRCQRIDGTVVAVLLQARSQTRSTRRRVLKGQRGRTLRRRRAAVGLERGQRNIVGLVGAWRSQVTAVVVGRNIGAVQMRWRENIFVHCRIASV